MAVLLCALGGSSVPAGGSEPWRAPPPCPGASGHAPRLRPAAPDDVNGDGYDDLVTSGQVKHRPGGRWYRFDAVGYGSPRGVVPAKGTSLARCVPGITTRYGVRPRVRGDFDRDGFADLVMAAGRRQRIVWGGPNGPVSSTPLPGFAAEDVGDVDGDGMLDLVTVEYGGTGNDPEVDEARVLYGPISRSGGAARTTRVDVSQGGWVPPADAVAGDFDGDGRTDLAVFGRFFEEDARFEDENAPDVDAVRWFRGTRTGLRPAGAVGALTRGMGLDLGPSRQGASGDLDGDGYDDLIVPVPARTGGPEAGAVTVVYGGPDGFGRAATYLDQNTPGVPGTGESGDHFGDLLAVGDVDADGCDDLAVTATGENRFEGSVTLFPGGRGGVSATGARRFDLDTPGIPGEPNRGNGHEYFGSDIQLLDLDRDGHADLVAGAPSYWPGEYRPGGFRPPGFWRDRRVGAYWILRGGPGGLTSDGVRSFPARSLGG
jgi:hypothetical protein